MTETLAEIVARHSQGGRIVETIEAVYAAIESYADPALFLAQRPKAEVLDIAARLEAEGPKGRPLFGVPFAVKDNIDVAGLPTTAACPAFAYTPETSSFVVERLEAAGGIAIGKTNLDQFATGLVGTRSPYGACRNSFDPADISGGSSSGSAVAVALGLASFSLGTDTAGSGRVPAAFNNLIGLKPSCGRLSTRGPTQKGRRFPTAEDLRPPSISGRSGRRPHPPEHQEAPAHEARREDQCQSEPDVDVVNPQCFRRQAQSS